jgi:hypothetical protein
MPYTKEVLGLGFHNTGRFVELHSCGLTQQYIEEFVEMGLDAWTPQPINDLDIADEKVRRKNMPDGETSRKSARRNPKRKPGNLSGKFVDKYAPRGKNRPRVPS